MHLEPKLDPAGPCSVNTEFLHLIYKQFERLSIPALTVPPNAT